MILDFLLLIFGMPILFFMAMYANKGLSNLFNCYFITHVIDTLLNNESAPIFSFIGFGITIWDIFGFVIIIAAAVRLKSGDIRFKKSDIILKFFLLYFVAELAIVLLSVYQYGPRTLSTYKSSFYFFPFLLLIMSYRLEGDLSSFVRLIKLIAFFSVVIYAFRAFGVLPQYHHYIEGLGYGKNDYAELRLLSNFEVLVLLMLAIYYLTYKSDLSSEQNLYFYLAVFLIVISTQRMLGFLMVFSFILILMVYSRKAIPTLMKVVVFSIILLSLLPSSMLAKLSYAFLNVVVGFESSNAVYRLLDAQAVISEMFQQFDPIIGTLIQPTMFARRIGGTILAFPVHNLFVLSFVRGGLFLVVPMILFWAFLYVKTLQLYLKSNKKKIVFVALLWLTVFILFNNTSGVGIFNAFVLGFCTQVIYKYDREYFIG